MNRRRARFLRSALTGARAWERGIAGVGALRPFPFALGRTDLRRALLHKVLIRSWDRLAASGDPSQLERALSDLQDAYMLTGAHQSVHTVALFEYLLESFQHELTARQEREIISRFHTTT